MKNVLDVNVRGRHVYYKVRVTKTVEVARNGKSRQAVITQLVLRFEYVTCLYLITIAFRPLENSSLARNIKNILKLKTVSNAATNLRSHRNFLENTENQ